MNEVDRIQNQILLLISFLFCVCECVAWYQLTHWPVLVCCLGVLDHWCGGQYMWNTSFTSKNMGPTLTSTHMQIDIHNLLLCSPYSKKSMYYSGSSLASIKERSHKKFVCAIWIWRWRGAFSICCCGKKVVIAWWAYFLLYSNPILH